MDSSKQCQRTPHSNLPIFPLSSTPFNFIQAPHFPDNLRATNVAREAQKPIVSTVDKFLRRVDSLSSQNAVLDKLISFPLEVLPALSCDPYLNIVWGIIPPLGGTLDLSPILAFLGLNAFTSSSSRCIKRDFPSYSSASP